MVGPVEFLNVRLDAAEQAGAVVPALTGLVDRGLIHLLDLVFVTRGEDGAVTVAELDDMAEPVRTAFAALDGEYGGLLSDDDVATVAETLSPGATAMALVWENLWANDLFAAIADIGGLAEDLHIPAAVAEPALSSLPGEGPGPEPKE